MKFYKVQTQACGVSTQRQWTGIMALCAQILGLMSVSGDKAPDGPLSKGTLRLGRQDVYLKICSPKLISEHTLPTFQSIVSVQTPHMPMFGLCKISCFNRWVLYLICPVGGAIQIRMIYIFLQTANNIPYHKKMGYNMTNIYYISPISTPNREAEIFRCFLGFNKFSFLLDNYKEKFISLNKCSFS